MPRRYATIAASAGSRRRWACFCSPLLSPLNTLADGYLFSAHMAQHILLLLIVPALLLLSLPRPLSLAVGPRVLAQPLVGWLAGVGAMWFWHAPALCNAAVASPPVHALQIVSLLVLGSLFWRQILAPREQERLSPPGAVLYLFSALASPAACSGSSSPLAGHGLFDLHHAAKRPSRDAANHSHGLGFLAGARPANRRSAHVGAHVFDLFERDLRPNGALVCAVPKPGNRKSIMNNATPTSHAGWNRYPPERLPAPHLFPCRIGDGNDLDSSGA